jgi:hypothetical protein
MWAFAVPVVLVLEGAVAVWAESVLPTDGSSCSRACRRRQRARQPETLRSDERLGGCVCSGRSALRRPEVLAGVIARGFVVEDNRLSNLFERDCAERGSGLRWQVGSVYNETGVNERAAVMARQERRRLHN